MRLTWWSFLTLVFVVFTNISTLVIAHKIPFSPNDSALISINSSSQLTSFLDQNYYVFVKFFNPSCPHCQAMAPAYVNLSRVLFQYNHNGTTPKNRTVACLEVDLSKMSNRALNDQYDISGVPTLLFFYGNSTYDEYEGARTANDMFKFIQNSLKLAEGPGIPCLRSEQDVLDFVELVGKRPIVISVLQTDFDWRQFFLSDAQLPFNEWFELTSSVMPNPKPMFATVTDPLFLVPSGTVCLKRYRQQSERFSTLPIAVTAPSAAHFCRESFWYYPGVKDSESLSSFVHTSIIRRGEYVKLTSENSRHIINADRPLIFVFGKNPRPGYSAQYTLSSLSRMRTTRPVVPIYASRLLFPDLVDYLHLSNKVNDSEESSSQHDVVLYYNGNMGPIIRIFKPGGAVSLSKWALTEALALNNVTVSTSAGSVLFLNVSNWRGLFDFDPRSVLLLLTQDDPDSFVHFLNTIAQLLQPLAGRIVVARYDSTNVNSSVDRKSLSGALPPNPDFSDILERPVLVLVSPGEGVRRYDGQWTPRAVARFARRWASTDGSATDGIIGEDVAIAICFLLGLFFVFYGCMISPLWASLTGNYWRKSKGNGGSGNKRL